MPTDKLQSRVDALEERIAHQDQTIDDLSETATALFKQIDALKRDLSRLTDQIQEMEQSAGAPGGREPPPPHY